MSVCPKKSIAVDLKSPEGVDIVKELLKDADVLLQNFRPGVLARLGLGYEDVKQIRPDIVYVSSSGFGQTGPYKDRPAYDPVIQGTSGLMAITGNGDQPAIIEGVADVRGSGSCTVRYTLHLLAPY